FLYWSQGPRKPAGRRYRPGLERLEDRRVPATFSNPVAITVPATGTVGIAASYPSHIVVSGLGGTVRQGTGTLNGFPHDFPADVRIRLGAPDGTNATILSDVGGATPVSGLTLTLDDASPTPLPNDGPLTSGTFHPLNATVFADDFPAPAPSPSGGATL